MELLTRLEDIQQQLEESWPKILEKTLNEFPHGEEDFYIYTFTKWQYHTFDPISGEMIPLTPPTFNLIHCPIKILCKSWFLPGSTMRKVSPKNSSIEILWTLPEEHAFDLYASGKIFADPIVHDSIRKYKEGAFQEAYIKL